MKKIIKSIAVFFTLLLLASFFFNSCKKKDAVPTEEAFSNFLADSTMRVVVTATNNPTYYEFGLRFQVIKEGNIVKVGSRLPNAGTYRISIWDVATKTVLLQQNVFQNKANTQAWADISSLALTLNKDYFISIASNNWNDAYLKTNKSISYPLIKGNVKIMAFGYASQSNSTSPARYPNLEDNINSISGFVDFGFIPN